MRKITQENIGEILQRIYDSEIHFKLGWFWDTGVDYELFDNQKGFVREPTMETDIVKAMEDIIPVLLEKYPTSVFTKWFTSSYEKYQFTT